MAGRNKQQNKAPWWAPPKTRQQARKQAWQETRPEYLPVKRQLRAEAAASRQRQKQVGNWWNEYTAKVNQNQQTVQQAYDAANQQAANLIQTTSAADNANTQRLAEQAAQSAALRGVEAPTQPQQTAASAQAMRNLTSANNGAALAAQGANQFAYLGGQALIGQGQGIKSRLDEQARERKINQDLLAAKKEQGGQAVKNFQHQKSEANEIALKRQAFGLEKSEGQRQAAEDAEDNRRANEKQANENFKTEHPNYGQGASGGESASERKEHKQAWNNARAAASNLYNAGYKHKNKKGEWEISEWPSWEVLAQSVAEESEVSPAMARAAVKKLRERTEGALHPAVPGL